jgi:hypothetical protein
MKYRGKPNRRYRKWTKIICKNIIRRTLTTFVCTLVTGFKAYQESMQRFRDDMVDAIAYSLQVTNAPKETSNDQDS